MPPRYERSETAPIAQRAIALFRFDRSFSASGSSPAPTRPGAGVWPGPLVAAAVAFDLESLTRRRQPRPGRARRLQTPDRRLARQALASAIMLPRAADRRQGRHAPRRSTATACTRPTCACWRSASRPSTRCADVCISDGFRLPDPAPDHRAVIEGDSKSAAVAAASVIAKTTRDRMMVGPAHDMWPQFGFEHHVGYATREHQDALRAGGLSPLHRRSFRSVAYPELRLFGDAGVSTDSSISNASAM